MTNLTLALFSFALLTGCTSSDFMGSNQEIKDNYALGAGDAADAGDDADTGKGKGGKGSDDDSSSANGIDGGDSEGGYDSDSESDDDDLSLTEEDFGFKNFCSSKTSKGTGTEVVSASSGIVAKLIDANSFEVKHTFSKDSVSRQIRDDLMNSKGISLVLRDDNGKRPKAGTYYLALCDKSDSTCTLTRSFKDMVDADEDKYSDWEDNPSQGLVGFIAGSGISINEDSEVTSYDTNKAWALYEGEDGHQWHECDVSNSPLMVDLQGHDLEFSKITAGALFDVNADGKQDLISWPVRASIAFLALDVSGNGKIDSGTELFGNHTVGPDGKKSANGFDALAKHDGNRDGKIDANDIIFWSLVFWSDTNRNGVTDAGELVGASKAGLKSIDLAYVDLHKAGKTELDQWKNQFRQRSTITMEGDKQLPITDVWFRQIPGLKTLTAAR